MVACCPDGGDCENKDVNDGISSVKRFFSNNAVFFQFKNAPLSSKRNAKTDYDKATRISYWQTYEGSPYIGIHEYVEGGGEFVIQRLKKPSQDFHTGYSFVYSDSLVFEDRANKVQYVLLSNGDFKKTKIPNGHRNRYLSSIYELSFDYDSSTVSACLITNKDHCARTTIKKGTFIYLYSESANSILAVSNYGDALLFKNGSWCRMKMNNDVYSCSQPEPGLIETPRAIQFYSSINYKNRTLIGEWPTGRIYEFNGDELKPSDMTPPLIERQSASRLGYEAQSMAEYCGDLFVGYWPKGEVWRWDHLNKSWSLFRRFFSAVDNEKFIPHSNRKPDELDASFFGQRITSLVPFADSLYVTTSNLLDWDAKKTPKITILGKNEDEYGAIYKITRVGCYSSYLDIKR